MTGSVAAVMTEDPITMEANETLEVAHALMVSSSIHHLPVTSHGELCGILSARDLAGAAYDLPARRVMHAPVETLAPEDSIHVAAERLLAHHFSSLPVLRDGKVAGIVTSSDLVRVACERLRDEPVSRLMTPSPLVTAERELTIGAALQRMKNAHIRHLPVLEGDELVGFVSDLDLLDGDGDATVGQAMAVRFTQVPEAAAAGIAGRLMVRDRLDALPVMRRGRLVGVISAFDFLRFLLQ